MRFLILIFRHIPTIFTVFGFFRLIYIINFSIMSLDRVMDGDLEPIIEALQTEDLKLKLAGEKFE